MFLWLLDRLLQKILERFLKYDFQLVSGDSNQNCILMNKAELLQEGIFFLIHFFARDVWVMKKLEIEKTKPTFIISVLKVEC